MARTYNRRSKPKPRKKARKGVVKNANNGISQRVNVVVNPLFMGGARRRFAMRGRRNVAPHSMFGIAPVIHVQLPPVTAGAAAAIGNRLQAVQAQPIPGAGRRVGPEYAAMGERAGPLQGAAAYQQRGERQFEHADPQPYGGGAGGAGRRATPATTLQRRRPSTLMRELDRAGGTGDSDGGDESDGASPGFLDSFRGFVNRTGHQVSPGFPPS